MHTLCVIIDIDNYIELITFDVIPVEKLQQSYIFILDVNTGCNCNKNEAHADQLVCRFSMHSILYYEFCVIMLPSEVMMSFVVRKPSNNCVSLLSTHG